MIVFDNWDIQPKKDILLRQFDNCVDTLKVTGNLPVGWEWVMMVRSGQNMDCLPMEHMDGGIGTVLTAERLAYSGFYCLQLRGKKGEMVRHTNVMTIYVESSLSGDAQWPELPDAFSQLERRITEKVAEAEGYAHFRRQRKLVGLERNDL